MDRKIEIHIYNTGDEVGARIVILDGEENTIHSPKEHVVELGNDSVLSLRVRAKEVSDLEYNWVRVIGDG